MLSKSGFVAAVSLIALSGTLVYGTAGPAAPASAAVVVADATSATTPSAALALATQFHHSVIVDSETTPTEQTSALADGTMQLVESTIPVRVKTSSGWTAVNSDLRASSDGFLSPVATDTAVEFSEGGSAVLARVQSSTGAWLSEASPFGILPKPTIKGSVATYANVVPGVDLRLTASAEGMSEVLVIGSAKAAANPLLRAVKFGVSGSALTSSVGGPTTATAPDGSQVLSTTPMWWDSSDGSDSSGPAGNAFAEPVQQSDNKSSISLNAQAALSSRAVKYPVYVDPDWTGGLQAFTDVDAAYQSTSYWDGAFTTNGDLGTGFVAAGYSPDAKNHTARSLWQMDTSAVEGDVITAATFNVTEDHAFNCTPSEVDLWTSGGISSATTWSNQPGVLQQQSSATVAYGDAGCPTHVVGFDATSGVQGGAAANSPSLTLELRAANEATSSSWKRFSQSASLIIDYNSVTSTPTSPTITAPARTCGTSASPAVVNNNNYPVTFRVTAADPDPSSNVSTTFSVYRSGVSNPVLTSSTAPQAQGPQSVTFAANAPQLMSNSTKFYWTATSSDGVSQSSPSVPCYFVNDSSNPSIPSVSKVSEPTVVGAPFTVQFSSTGNIASFAYWWADGFASSPRPGPPSVFVPSEYSLPPDGYASGPVRFASPATISNGIATSAVISVAPIDTNATLYVSTIDTGGNESFTRGNYSTALQVGALPSPEVDFTHGHEWALDSLSSLSNPVLDSNTNHPGATSPANTDEADLQLVSPVDTSTTDTIGSPFGAPVLNFNSTNVTGIVSTTHEALDTESSFTATAWAFPTALPATGQLATVLAQSGGATSAFAIQLNSAGQYQLCLTAQSTGAPTGCSTWSAAIELSNWTQVTGIWDAVNKQVRIVVGNSVADATTSPYDTTPAVFTGASTAATVAGPIYVTAESYFPAPPVQPGDLVIGSDYEGDTNSSPWVGEIDDPAVFPGVIDNAQLSNMYLFLDVNNDPGTP